MATPWETMKQQPMANSWENKQNCGVRHKVLKVGRRQQTTLKHILTQDLSLRGVRHNPNLNDKHLHDKAIPN
jgi:hypothetical protein